MPVVEEKKERVRRAKALVEPIVAAEVVAAAAKGAEAGDGESGMDPLDPVASAKAAGLRYVTDRKPGIRRHPVGNSGKDFEYTEDPSGDKVTEEKTLARIKSLVIPPAWTDVWICKQVNGHLQATGRDARGRKQSRYHPKWREVRDGTKYERMVHFAAALPKIRERVNHDLKLPGLPRNKVLATIVSLMELTHIRVGNQEYAKENKSYGLTTMRNKHVEVHGADVTFSFQGKSRVHHTISLHDRRLARIIKACEEIPGYELFQYLDHDGNHHAIDSADVNGYLQEISGEHFTAKDFRTWAGTLLASEMLRNLGPSETATQAKKNVVEAIKAVAKQLGNTPAVCRKAYVHPAVLEAYLSGNISAEAAKEKLEEEIAEHEHALRQEEMMLVALLEQRTALEAA
jgi:DNA topoisomerase I